ncbi:MAG: enoyl-CoA hydratase/isomerase family protein [Bryobacteraceae bacterium]
MNLEISRQGRVLRLTLARPEKRNALDAELCGDLAAALEKAQSDPATGAILLDAQGVDFCAGMDLHEAMEPEAAVRTTIHEQLFTIGSRMTKPIVAAVQGRALAGGLGLVANAHIVVASEDAAFGLTEARIGMWPFVVFRAVSRALGERRATELSLTARIFSAADAHAWGLVNFTAPFFEVAPRALEIAVGLSQSSASAIATGLDFVNRSRTLDSTAAGRLAIQMRAYLFQSPDFAEGVRAFREKRRPRWPSNPS